MPETPVGQVISAATMALVRAHNAKEQASIREALKDKKAAKERQKKAIAEKKAGRTVWNDCGFKPKAPGTGEP